jgi:hypothetical protein
VSWREEARQDRLIRARIEQDQAAAAARARIERDMAAAVRRRDDDAARRAARNEARQAAAARRAARAGWVREHVIDLLFVPVIAVPGALAWTAMAAYGDQLYGPVGLLLPAFSEGAMWAFAAANTLTRRRHPGRPTWHLMAGTWVFAGTGAALNFAHGLTLPGSHAAAGPIAGAVMALVSAAGVAGHQLVTAGPRRSRADRRQARLERAAARRELAVRAAAVRSAAAELDEHGSARLVFRPGLVMLRRGRIVLDRVPEAAPEPQFPIGLQLAGAVSPWPAPESPAPALPEADTPVPEVHPAAPEPPAGLNGTGHAALEIFAADIAAGTVPSVRRVRREMHLGQPRAKQVHAFLAGRARTP